LVAHSHDAVSVFIDAKRLAVCVPCSNRFKEVGELLPKAVGSQRLVEAGVWLRNRGQQYLPGEVKPLISVTHYQLAATGHLADPAIGEPNVDSTPVRRA